MNLADLSKEQKQYLVLGAVVAFVLVSAVIFSVRFSHSTISEAREELEGLSEKIKRADREMSRRSKTQREFEKTAASLNANFENVPPARNYYSWATEIVYATARATGLEVDAIEEIKTSASGRGKKNVRLEIYSLRITARGGFENVKQFIQSFEENQPLVRLAGLEISAQSNPDTHDVQLFIQWPFNLTEIAQMGDYVEKVPAVVTEPAAPVVEATAHRSESPAQAVETVDLEDSAVEKTAGNEAVVVQSPEPAKVPAKTLIPESKPMPDPQPVQTLPVTESPRSAGAVVVTHEREPVEASVSSQDLEEPLKTTEVEPVPEARVPVFLPREIDGNSKADKKLAALLQKQAPEADETLVSFLDGLVEEINEK